MSIMTKELARNIEQVDIDYTISRLGSMQAAQGNPLQIEIRQFGDTTAFLIQAWPDFWYGNRVLGLGPSDEGQLEAIVNYFDEQRLPFRFEIIPGQMSWPLATRLHQLGFCQGSFSAALYGSPQPHPVHPAPAVSVHKVQPDELDLFLDLYQDGFGLEKLSSRDKEIVRLWPALEQAHLDFYIATVNDTPAGIAVFYVKGRFGLLADAATLPGFRGYGCQTTLIHQRILQAAQQNCDLLVSFVEFGATSHKNLERAGLRIAYTKAMWWKVE